MNKIFENAYEQHIRSINLYLNSSDSILYLDANKTEAIDKETLQRLFDIGVINIVDGDKQYRAINFKDDCVIYLTDAAKSVKAYAAGAVIDGPVLSISATSDTPILGKNVSEFQSNINIGDSKITGTLNYIDS